MKEAVFRTVIVVSALLGGLGLFAFAARLWWNHSPGEERYPGYAIDVTCPRGDTTRAAGTTLVGVASSNITPEVPDVFVDVDGDGRFNIGVDTWLDLNRNRRFDAVWLAGEHNARPAGSVADSLYANVIVFGNAACRVAICAVDAFAIPFDDVIAVRARVADLLSGTPDSLTYVAVVATGTHGAPDLIGLWGRNEEESGRDPTYAARVRHAMVDAIVRAARAAQPAKIERLASPHTPGAMLFRNTAGTPIALFKFNEIGALGTATRRVLVSAGADSAASALALPAGLAAGAVTEIRLPVLPRSFARGGEARLPFTVRKEGNQPPSVAVRARTVSVPVGSGTMRAAATLGLVERVFLEGNLRTEVGVVELGELELVLIPGDLHPDAIEGLMGTGTKRGARERYFVARANDYLGELADAGVPSRGNRGPALTIGHAGRRATLQEVQDLVNDR